MDKFTKTTEKLTNFANNKILKRLKEKDSRTKTVSQELKSESNIEF